MNNKKKQDNKTTPFTNKTDNLIQFTFIVFNFSFYKINIYCFSFAKNHQINKVMIIQVDSKFILVLIMIIVV